MKLKLKHPKETLPSGCEFREPKTGKLFNAYEAGISGAVLQIITHRLSNNSVFDRNESHLFDPRAVTQELFQSAAKVRPDLFVEYEASSVYGVERIAAPTGKCPCGSSDFEPQYCPTCGGQKLIGYKCKVCGLPK